MERIEAAFRKHLRRKALIPFLNAGDPDFESSLEFFRSVLRAGADIVEIGAPYSDPLADGPVIQNSAGRSLTSGFRLPHVFELAHALRRETDGGVVLFTYVNPLLQYSPEQFFLDASASGVDGVIVPDLPHEESAVIRAVADGYGIALIPLIAPTSDETRISSVCADARGFVYCVSSLGVTGERVHMSERVEQLVAAARTYTSLPVAVGFGVSSPQQARTISRFADGVIVGSAFIRRIEQGLAAGESTQIVANTLAGLAHDLTEAMRTD